MTSKDEEEVEDSSALFARTMTGDLPFIRARDLVMNDSLHLFVVRAQSLRCARRVATLLRQNP
jgi:hypothetical protein